MNPPASRRTFTRLLRIAAPFRWWMALSALLGFLTIGSSIGLMSTSAWIIASAALHPHISTLNVAIVGVRFFGIARGVFRYLERYVSHETTFRLLARLRVWFFQGIEPLAPARLMEHRSGDLLSRVVADIDTLENFYLRVIGPPVIAVIVGLVMMVFMGAHDIWLAASLVVFHLLAGIGVPLLTRRLSQASAVAMLTTRSELSVALVDGVQGLADLVAYDAQDRQLERVQALSRGVQRHNRQMARVAALDGALLGLITGSAVLATLLIAIPLVREGRLDGVLLAVLALATMTSFEGVAALPQASQHLDANLAAARRLFELVDATPAVQDPPAPLPVPDWSAAGSGLAFENVRFRYATSDPPALDGVSFKLRPGSTVAVVGASGAGKSTLAHLLLRFWDVDEGRIVLNGHDVRAYAAEDVRALFGVVSQRTHLFNATIRDNLLLARPTARDDEIERALEAAQLHDLVAALPDGLGTWIGEQGLALSGGERQRLAIARALLKDAPVLVLDEATANLDPVTERAILDTLQSALAGRTTLLITHRLAGLETAAEILVLDAGRVVERGTLDELLASGGHFRRLWDIQYQALSDAPTEN